MRYCPVYYGNPKVSLGWKIIVYGSIPDLELISYILIAKGMVTFTANKLFADI